MNYRTGCKINFTQLIYQKRKNLSCPYANKTSVYNEIMLMGNNNFNNEHLCQFHFEHGLVKFNYWRGLVLAWTTYNNNTNGLVCLANLV